MSVKSRFLKFSSLFAMLAMMLSSIQPMVASAQGGDGVQRQLNAESGRVSFLGPQSGRFVSAAKALGVSARPQDPAMALATRFGPEFGLKDPERELSLMKDSRSDDGRLIVRYQQQYDGVPVLGGELIVNTDDEANLYSMSGEVSKDLTLSTQPSIDAGQARQTALESLAKLYGKTTDDFIATEPALWVYDESLLQPSTKPAELVWRMEVKAKDIDLPVRELVLVNAQRGNLSLHFNQIDIEWSSANGSGSYAPADLQADGTAESVAAQTDVMSPIQIKTYTANNGTTLPGTLLCTLSSPACTGGADPHADKAHQYAIGTYNMYLNTHGRYSIDGLNMPIISSVHYSSNYENAYWDGGQMVYGDAAGFPLADDVVAHELTHGVTQYESNLFYYYQSGAINESFSDVWGEYYDQTNGLGNDTAGVKWQMGEDVTGLGALRNMSDPTIFGDPDKMSSANYYEGAGDHGGVHTNSGLNNKAVFLMVDGGTFNGRTVTALGWSKTIAIYYEVQAHLLASGADYSDLYYALQQACTNLIGQKGITSGDCTEVKDAADAVEMNGQPAPNFNTNAPVCDGGKTPRNFFADNLEGATLANWTLANGANVRWQHDAPPDYGQYAQSGLHFLYADDYPATITNATARLVAFAVPPAAYLHFAQAYDFESGSFDGGVLEYSTNGGSTWNDAGPLMQYNSYNGTISSSYGNPLGGRSGFVNTSHGYISTRLNLSSLAGQTVTFRWRLGLDSSGYALGWWVDNIRAYTCTTFADVNTSYWAWNYIERLYSAGITGGCSVSPLNYCPEVTVNRAQMAVFLLRGIHGSSYTPPAVGLSTGFGDVPTNYWAAAWIKQLAAEGITGGCGNGNYCPELPVTRDQMAVFLLRSEHGAGYTPPVLVGGTGFGDVPSNHWAAAWIKQLVNEGITAGCGGGNYCPNTVVNRAQMAVFLVRTFGLP